MSRLARALSFLSLITAGTAAAQTWDNTGNNLLNGTYYFRDVTYTLGSDGAGDISYAAALYGSITFDGNGNYTMNTPWLVDSQGNNNAQSNLTGTYTIAASGYGSLKNPFGDSIYGLVSNGVFVGSSTESGFNDLFIAVTAATQATSATLVGNYSIAYMSVPDGNPGDNYDALGQFTADGRGNIGTVSFTAYTGAGGSSAIPVSESGVRYTFSNGAANLSFPTSGNPAVGGTQFLYISPDGNFVFGGSNSFWDFFVGVRKGTAASFGGGSTYYQAGLTEDASQLGTKGFAIIGSYYGSLVTTPSGAIIGHQRFEDVFGTGVEDDTYSDSYPVGTAGQYTDGSIQYMFSQDGGVRVGFGVGPFLGIDVAVRGPSFSGSGVFLDPTGVRNAASFAPFTAQLARGELIELTGSGLANHTVIQSTAPFPNMLDGVQVFINNVAAPLYYVTPGQIAAVVPYEATAAIAQIQVVNNGVPSKAVTAYIGATAPGMLAQGSNGISDALVQHLDSKFSLVTPANPAQPGETLLGYVTGLGDVSPTILDGAPGPSGTTLSNATNTITVNVGGQTATVSFAGLAPTLSGLYAIVFVVPTGVASGEQSFTLGGPDAFSFESTLPIGAASSGVNSASRAGTSRATRNRSRSGKRSESTRKGVVSSPLF